jgi:serine O-acetyltransferase
MHSMTALSAVRRALVLPLGALARTAPSRAALERDVRRFRQPRLDLPLEDSLSTGELLDALRHREVRSVLYLRLRLDGGLWAVAAIVLSRLLPGQVALSFNCGDVGPGMFVSHGFATIVVAQRIGADCLISQQVTVGYSDKGGPPTLGDRVRVGAGAMILGPVHVGDDAVVGAGAVVVHDVPAGKVVAGVPARVIEHAEDRFSALRASG